MARNRFVDHRRRQVLDFERLRELSLWPSPPRVASPFEETQASEAQQRVERAIACLPIKYREAILLVAVEGLEQQDAARALGISPDSLRQRLSRARKLLRESLGES